LVKKGREHGKVRKAGHYWVTHEGEEQETSRSTSPESGGEIGKLAYCAGNTQKTVDHSSKFSPEENDQKNLGRRERGKFESEMPKKKVP